MPEGITVDLVPDPTGVDSLTKQIRQTGRAYPLFDIAHLILKRPDRYQLDFHATGNNPDGTPRQFHLCSLDDTIWLSQNEVVRHILSKHFGTFYQVEKIPVDPPKGTYTFVAQCGMSGTILGPPNLHDYQAKLQRLHAERFSRVPFDAYKSRVRIVRDETVVKQWIEEQSFKFEYVALNLPEPLKLESRDAVEQHFRQVHLANLVQSVAKHSVRTPAAREALPPPLRRLARREFDLQQRFPLKLVTRLSDDFAHRGLHFFKVNKTVLHVAVARPRFLDMESNPVTEGVRKIVEAIQATPACTRRKLLGALGVELPAAVDPAAAAAAVAAGETPAPEVAPSPELQSIVTDLHWLIHEGHVIEFANGHLETAKRPVPRPQPAPRPPRPTPAPAASTPAPAASQGSAAPEAATAPATPAVTGEETEVSSASVSPEAPVEPALPDANANATAPAPPAAPAIEDEGKINPS